MQLIRQAANWLVGESNLSAPKVKEVAEGFKKSLPSLPDRLAIVDFCDEDNVFLLEDGVSVGSGFEIGDIPAESANQAHLDAVFKKVLDVFSYVVPLHSDNPWVMQLFVSDEFSLKAVANSFEQSIDEDIRNSAYSQDFCQQLNNLYAKMTRKEGLFVDGDTELNYRGRLRRIRTLFYRRYSEQDKKNPVTRLQALKEHQKVAGRIKKKLKSAGIDVARLTGDKYYSWWVRWFNPNPRLTKGDTEQLFTQFPYPKEKPASFSFAQNIFFSNPETTEDAFVFDGMPHRVIFSDGLSGIPEIGQISREMRDLSNKKSYALLDKLPEGSTYTLQVVFADNVSLSSHLKHVEQGVIGSGSERRQIRNDIATARDEIEMGNRLYWVTQAVYFRGKDRDELQENEENIIDLFLNNAKMSLIPSHLDLHPVDSYLSVLPFNFNYSYFKKYLSFDRLMYATEMAALMPVYGRFKGAKGMHSLPFFNRVGEPINFDLLHKKFITKNSHCAIFADSGGGKSVLSGWMVSSLMATKNPRIVLFEMGNSFGGLVNHAKQMGKKVKQLVFTNDASRAIALNPFANWDKALLDIKKQEASELIEGQAKVLHDLNESKDSVASEEEMACDASKRDYVAELCLALRTMITQANEKEEDGWTLADDTLLIEVLTDAVVNTANEGHTQMLTEHVLAAMARKLNAETNPKKKDKIQDMHDKVKSYVIGGQARFFNVKSEPLDDFDLFHIDVQSIQDNKGMLALVMVSLLPRILALAEENQYESRSMFLFIDESHLQFQIPVVTAYATLIAKVARKLGLWLVVITQNVSDLSSEQAKKILSLCETWIVLGIDEQELANVQQFKSLTPEQISLIRSIDSEKGVYSEAVLLGSRHQGLFRVIPTRDLLVRLMTEKDEKTKRRKLEKIYGENKAVRIMAEELENQAPKAIAEDYFPGY